MAFSPIGAGRHAVSNSRMRFEFANPSCRCCSASLRAELRQSHRRIHRACAGRSMAALSRASRSSTRGRTGRSVVLPLRPGLTAIEAVEAAGLVRAIRRLPRDRSNSGYSASGSSRRNAWCSDGDRVEIYRPLPADPKAAPAASGRTAVPDCGKSPMALAGRRSGARAQPPAGGGVTGGASLAGASGRRGGAVGGGRGAGALARCCGWPAVAACPVGPQLLDVGASGRSSLSTC